MLYLTHFEHLSVAARAQEQPSISRQQGYSWFARGYFKSVNPLPHSSPQLDTFHFPTWYTDLAQLGRQSRQVFFPTCFPWPGIPPSQARTAWELAKPNEMRPPCLDPPGSPGRQIQPRAGRFRHMGVHEQTQRLNHHAEFVIQSQTLPSGGLAQILALPCT